MAVVIVRPQPVGGSEVNAFADVGFYVALVYIFVLFSRLAENFPSLHLALLLTLVLSILMVLTGAIRRAIFNRVGLPLILFTIWMVVCIPFSVWPGGSFQSVSDWLKCFVAFPIVVAFVTDVRRCRMAMYAVMLGILWVGLIGVISGNVNLSRLAMGMGRFGDANDFAQILLVGMALLCCAASYPGRGVVAKLLLGGLILIELAAFFRSGSRGGLIGLVLTSLILFKQLSLVGKIKLIMVLALTTIIIAAALPSAIMVRYRTLWTEGAQSVDTQEEYENQRAAEGSKQGRWYLLKTSLRLTFQHPLFGVGPGMFMVAENDGARSMGMANGLWHETHNMYTQVSSETGIPGLILYVLALFRALRDCGRIRKLRHDATERPPTEEQAQMAFWLNIAMWGFLTSGLFLSMAFTPELQGMVGLLAAFSQAVREENTLPQTAPIFAQPVRLRTAAAQLGFSGVSKHVY
jgi:O-antigen ligase